MLTVTLPNGVTQALGTGEWVMERTEQAGIYTVTSPREGVVQQFAVNLDSRESELRPVADDTLAKIIQCETITGLDSLRQWLDQKRELTPLWPAFLLLALVVFVIETVVANVMSRNRSQSAEIHIATGRLNKRRLSQPFHNPTEVS